MATSWAAVPSPSAKRASAASAAAAAVAAVAAADARVAVSAVAAATATAPADAPSKRRRTLSPSVRGQDEIERRFPCSTRDELDPHRSLDLKLSCNLTAGRRAGRE